MISRREWSQRTLGAGGLLALDPLAVFANAAKLITRVIPGTNERLPLVRDRGIGVLVYAPFGRTRLWQRVKGREVPDWAREFEANSWARFFLKFVGSHPAVTAITPATSRPANMADNMGAAVGRLPDAAMRERMIQLVEALP